MYPNRAALLYLLLASCAAGEVEHGKSVLAEQYYPLGRLGTPADIVVPMVYFASDAADFVTGQILFVDGGYSAQ